jgi:Zn-dependent protease
MHLNVVLVLFEFAALIFAFSIHEAAHAWMASRLGDQTARLMGRVTLNPISHIDPLGSVIIPLIAMFYGAPLIGWAKPTPVQARNFVRYKRDSILVTLAGPLSNLLVALVSLVLLLFMKHFVPGGLIAIEGALMMYFHMADGALGSGVVAPIALLLYSCIVINVLLFVFNLLPLPPLDGSRIVDLYLSPRGSAIYAQVGRFSILIMMALVYLGFFSIFYSPIANLFNLALIKL